MLNTAQTKIQPLCSCPLTHGSSPALPSWCQKYSEHSQASRPCISPSSVWHRLSPSFKIFSASIKPNRLFQCWEAKVKGSVGFILILFHFPILQVEHKGHFLFPNKPFQVCASVQTMLLSPCAQPSASAVECPCQQVSSLKKTVYSPWPLTKPGMQEALSTYVCFMYLITILLTQIMF